MRRPFVYGLFWIVIALVTVNGHLWGLTVNGRYSYGPWDETMYEDLTGGNIAQPDFGYGGYFRSKYLPNLYLTEYRAYAPDLGRWLSRDPIGEEGGVNLYAYTGDDPVNGSDPLGTDPNDSYLMGVSETWYGYVASFIPFLPTDPADIDMRAAGLLGDVLQFPLMVVGDEAPAVGKGVKLAESAAEAEEAAKAAKVAEKTSGVWKLTRGGADKIMNSSWGKFFRSKSDGLWWVADNAGHGGSAFKVYRETGKGLEWVSDADKAGNFIVNKFKSSIGKFIPWSDLHGTGG